MHIHIYVFIYSMYFRVRTAQKDMYITPDMSPYVWLNP